MLTQLWSATDIISDHFRSFFALLPHCWDWTFKFRKNVKKHLQILSFYTCVPLIKIIWCMVPEMWSATDKMFLSSWANFCPFTPLTAKKWEYQKWKKPFEISSFYTSLLKIMIIFDIVPEIWLMLDVIFIFHFGQFFAPLPP